MAVALTLTIDNSEILGGLRRMRERAEDLRPVLADIGAELESSTVKRFVTNVAPDGTPWKASLRAERTGTPTLVLTSNLRDSIHYVADADGVSIGSNLVYAAIHQAGFDGEVVVSAHTRQFTMVFGRRISGTANVSSHSRKLDVPARKYLGMSENDNRVVLEIVGDHLASAARGAR